MIDTPTLEGFGLRLEPLTGKHIPELQKIALDPSIWRYMPLRIESAEDIEEMVRDSIRRAESGSQQIWVTRLMSGEVLGSSRLQDLDRKHRTAEIAFSWLTKPYRGAGVNPRVKLLQLTHAFEGLGLRRVALKTHHENLQSQRGILKLGAVYEGTFRNHLIMPDGSARHTLWYSILAEEWPEIRAALTSRISAEPMRIPSMAGAEPIQ